MQEDQQGLQETANEEGFRAFPYKDINGNWTVAYGHLILPGEDFSAGVTEAQGLALLNKDMSKAESIVNAELAPMITAGHVTQGEYDALCDAVYNMGDFLKGSTLLKLLLAGDTAGAEQQLARWDFVGSKPNAAIEARRVREMALWSKGEEG